jgi:benzodiazapine receptor
MKRDILRQFAVIFTTLFALVMNYASTALPLNGRTPAEISDSFNVLFVPAGYVFSIWGLIYIALLAYVIYHSLPSQRANPRLRRTGWLVAATSLVNGGWIFFWHFGYYVLSLAAMLALLGLLIAFYLQLNVGRAGFKGAERFTVAFLPSIYLGWITVATMANITAVLSYLGWNGWGISGTTWSVILLAAGVGVAAISAFTRRDAAYLLVLAWAFVGISVRWLSQPVLNGAGFAAAALVLVLLVASRLLRYPAPLAQVADPAS